MERSYEKRIWRNTEKRTDKKGRPMIQIFVDNANIFMALGLAVSIAAALLVKFTVGDEEERSRLYHLVGIIGCGVSLVASSELIITSIARGKIFAVYLVIFLIAAYGLIRNIRKFRDGL